MHELALMDSVVFAIGAKFREHSVTRVRLEIGRFTSVSTDALQFCFDVCVRGTTLEGAVLEIDEVAAQADCRRCGASVSMADLLTRCACGSADLQVRTGNELRIKEVEAA